MAAGKKIDKSAHIGDAGIALIHRRVSSMRHVWHPRGLDAGIDGTIELRDAATGEMSNRHIMVQSKASDRPFPSEDETRFHFVCRERDVDYWMRSEQPVILVCSHPETDEAWWVHVQTWFADPAHKATLRVDFDKATQSFDRGISARLFAVADPHGRAHTPVAEDRRELLVSNLLPVEVPDVFYSAPVDAIKVRAIYEAQRKTRHPLRHDFVLHRGRILTWEPTPGTSLALVPAAAARTIPACELASGGEDDRRLLAWMLNAALQDDVAEDCSWNNARKLLYFRATPDLKERKIRSASERSRLVFKGYYPRKDDPTKMSMYKHSALRCRFTGIDGEWYCNLKPDYFYTRDGERESAYADEYLAKIKARERNNAVLGETLMWATFLQGAETLIEQAPKILDFGPPVTFEVDRGLIDSEWRAPATDSWVLADQMSLFDEDDHL